LKPISLPLEGSGPLYEQLARALKRAILEGKLPAGGRLPATRSLAQTLGISRNTVIGAYELLSVEQLTTTRGGSGSWVSDIAPQVYGTSHGTPVGPQSRYAARTRKLDPLTQSAVRPQLRFDLHYGEPLLRPSLFRSWRRKVGAAALRAGPRYPDSRGFPALRRSIAQYLARRRGISCREEDVQIVSGTQQALALVARIVLDEGDIAVVEDPHYQNLGQCLAAHGARIRSVRVDDDGLVVSELAKHKPRLVCVTPSHQFPSGSALSLPRRMELLRLAATQGSWIFEDDYDSEFQCHRRPLPALRSLDLSDRVIYAGTFSKTLFPSLRLGYIVCPASLREDLFRAKRLEDLGCPTIEQAALAAFLQNRQFEKHLRKSVADLNRRRGVLIEGLQLHASDHVEVRDTGAGVHLIVWLKDMSYPQLDRLIELAAERNLGLYPIHPYYQKPPARPGLLLGYAGLSDASIRVATKRLGQCLRDLRAAD
jgi:GntR family transcriptional regulator / MocR family aminotransferase